MGDELPFKKGLNGFSAFVAKPISLAFRFTGLMSKCGKYAANKIERFVQPVSRLVRKGFEEQHLGLVASNFNRALQLFRKTERVPHRSLEDSL